MMYPLKDAFASWAASTQLRIDALGLINILGTDEVDTSVGRLVPSRYTEFLPLLGPFILASNQFAKTQPNFSLYNLTDGITTKELAGWFSRWLKAQDFHQIHHRIQWEVQEPPVSMAPRIWTALAVSISCNGLLLAITLLSADWWGFTNVLAMVVSILVRAILVWLNRAGIDEAVQNQSIREIEKAQDRAVEAIETAKDKAIEAILKAKDDPAQQQTDKAKSRGPEKAKGKQREDPNAPATVIVVMDDSKVVTMKIPRGLVMQVFTQIPTVPHPHLYRFVRWVGWVAYAAHMISIGMALLPTQIYTVFVVLVSTILTTFKCGCDDWRMGTRINHEMKSGNRPAGAGVSCLVSSRLAAICSEYPEKYDEWVRQAEEELSRRDSKRARNTTPTTSCQLQGKRQFDMEAQGVVARFTGNNKMQPRTKRRRDLFLWLDLTDKEVSLMQKWQILPQEENEKWWSDFRELRGIWKQDKQSHNL